MTTVLDTARRSGQMHALVVGVGHYPHCASAEAGVGPLAGLGRRFGQLSSPPQSALALAQWLLDEQVDDEVAPLGSVELLVSGVPAPVVGITDGPAEVDPPTWENVSEACDRWYQRCDSDSSNVALFFFSGHGFQYADRQALLLEDFGRSPHRILDNAVSFDRTVARMDQCRARTQCYFVDSCREMPYELRMLPPDGARSLVDPVPLDDGVALGLGPRDALTIFSTAPGERAWGHGGKVTVFTHALLAAMGGLAAQQDQVPGRWEVTTESLWPAVRRLLSRYGTTGSENQQAMLGHGPSLATPLRRLRQPPQIGFRLGCDPADALRNARMGLARLGDHSVEQWREPPRAEVWEGSTPAGLYSVGARFDSGGYCNTDQPMAFRPPYVDFALPVERT
jgi:hypothetical protein